MKMCTTNKGAATTQTGVMEGYGSKSGNSGKGSKSSGKSMKGGSYGGKKK